MAAEATPVLFAEDFDQRTFRLLEVPSQLLADFEGGTLSSLWFKAGNGDEPVVLCDDTTTFEVKTIDISNTMLLVEPSPGNSAMELTGSPRTVAGQVRSYLELVPIAPHTAKLKNMLAQCYFDGAAAEVADDGEEAVPLGLSTEELVDQVQASRTEILTALHSMHAIELDGRWRLLAPRYALETFRLIINTAIAQDWPLASLKSSQLREYLEDEHGIPVFVIETLLRQYGQAVDADCVALDEEAVLRFAAKEVFVEGDKWQYNSFLACWEEFIPPPFEPKLDALKGLALVTEDGPVKNIVLFDVSELSALPKERFGTLFAQRRAWTLTDISPYIKDLATASMTVEKLLFKYSRTFNDAQGVRVYTQR